MLRIEIRNLTRKRIPPVRLLKRATKKILKLLGKNDGELNVVFMTDRQIKSLNLRYRKRNRHTDVLAFSTQPLGDIAVSVDAAARQAKAFHSSKKREIYLYIIHGILHLLGYDDRTGRGSKLMQRKENKLLEAIWNSIT